MKAFSHLWRWLRGLVRKREPVSSVTRYSPRAERRREARQPWKRFARHYHLLRGQKGVKLSAIARMMFEPETMRQKHAPIPRRWQNTPAARAMRDARAAQKARATE